MPASVRAASAAGVRAAGSYDPRVDAYIDKCKPFAQPILEHLRELVHKAVPGAEETIKWSMPFFMVEGIILANMAGFKEHCSFGLWGDEVKALLKDEGAYSKQGMGVLGRIECVKDLPGDKAMLGYLKAAAQLVSDGTRTQSYTRPKKAAKPELETPPELAAALKKNKAAQATFDGFSPSCRRDYVEWIAEAKRDATRDARIAQAIAWMAEGKKRHWKYENC